MNPTHGEQPSGSPAGKLPSEATGEIAETKTKRKKKKKKKSAAGSKPVFGYYSASSVSTEALHPLLISFDQLESMLASGSDRARKQTLAQTKPKPVSKLTPTDISKNSPVSSTPSFKPFDELCEGVKMAHAQLELWEKVVSEAKSDKEFHSLWHSERAKPVHGLAFDIATRCNQFIEGDALTSLGNNALSATGKEHFYRQLMQAQQFLMDFFRLHGDSAKAYVLSRLNELLKGDLAPGSEEYEALYKNYQGAIQFYLLSLRQAKDLQKTQSKIEVSSTQPQELNNKAASTLASLHAIVSHIVVAAKNEAHQIKSDSSLSDEEKAMRSQRLMATILTEFGARAESITATHPLQDYEPFFQPTGSTPLEQFSSYCRKLLAEPSLGHDLNTFACLYAMKEFTATASAEGSGFPHCSITELDNAQILLFQETLRHCTNLFIAVELAHMNATELLHKQELMKQLTYLSDCTQAWWTALFPSQETDALEQAHKILQQLSHRCKKANQQYSKLIEQRAQSLKQFIEELEQEQKPQKKVRPNRLKALAVQHQSESEDSGLESTASSPAGTPRPRIKKDSWHYLNEGVEHLKNRKYASSTQSFEEAKKNSKSHETYCWAIYGQFDTFRQQASAIMLEQCRPAMTFLNNYHDMLCNRQEPSKTHGQHFFDEVSRFNNAMSSYQELLKTAQGHLLELTHSLFQKDKVSAHDKAVADSIAEVQAECQSEIEQLKQFTATLNDICQARREWLVSKNFHHKYDATNPPPDYGKILQDLNQTTTQLQTLMDNFQAQLKSDSLKLQSAAQE